MRMKSSIMIEEKVVGDNPDYDAGEEMWKTIESGTHWYAEIVPKSTSSADVAEQQQHHTREEIEIRYNHLLAEKFRRNIDLRLTTSEGDKYGIVGMRKVRGRAPKLMLDCVRVHT